MINTINIDDRSINRQLWVSSTTYHMKTPTQLSKSTQKLIFVFIFSVVTCDSGILKYFLLSEKDFLLSYPLLVTWTIQHWSLRSIWPRLATLGHPKSHGWSNPSFHSHSTKPYTIRRHFDHLSSSSMNIIQIYYCQCPWLVKFDHFIEI